MIDTRTLTTRLLSEASQENCDGPEHDLMIEAYHRIKELEEQIEGAIIFKPEPIFRGLAMASMTIVIVYVGIGIALVVAKKLSHNEIYNQCLVNNVCCEIIK